jgi:hypothetical protein
VLRRLGAILLKSFGAREGRGAGVCRAAGRGIDNSRLLANSDADIGKRVDV